MTVLLTKRKRKHHIRQERKAGIKGGKRGLLLLETNNIINTKNRIDDKSKSNRYCHSIQLQFYSILFETSMHAHHA